MPDLPCKSCRSRCSMFIESQFCINWMSAWAADKPLPECFHFKGVYQKGAAA